MAKDPNQVAKASATDAAKADKKSAASSAKQSSPDRNRLRKRYKEVLAAEIKKDLSLKNINAVPRLEKIVLNMGLGDVKDNSKSFNLAMAELASIAGQKPIITKAKKSVANFKVREGMNIGIKVTLRGDRMYEFFDKLVSVALPRVRDFRGISPKSFDGRGNFSMGVKEQLIFPEISYDQIEKIRGFDVCIVTTARTDEQAKVLLTKLGMPFKAN